jgi:hypothetical protein
MLSGAAPTGVLAMLLLAACVQEGDPPAEATASGDPTLHAPTGLKMDGDWRIVMGACTACHSARLITQQRGSAQQWLTMIRWMQKKQNLWEFEPDIEERIITYLADNYPPEAARRRAAIPPDLMPPNPYSTEE